MGTVQCIVVQHVAFEDLGTFAPVIEDAGYTIRYLQAGVDDLAPVVDADLAVILGGPIGVYETDAYPFLRDEIAVLTARLDAVKPTLGICLGAQLIATVLGARVYPGARGKEIGWSPIRLSAAGRRGPLSYLGDDVVLHWHGDTFDLPDGVVLLASSERYEHQAFSYGSCVLALQFHPEVDPKTFERWLIGHTVEIGSVTDLSPRALREDAERYGAGVARRGRRFLEEWLSRVSRRIPGI
ncbi:MAG: glutamine amidotransferase [Alkalispirochaeta sp.]